MLSNENIVQSPTKLIELEERRAEFQRTTPGSCVKCLDKTAINASESVASNQSFLFPDSDLDENEQIGYSTFSITDPEMRKLCRQ